MSANATHDATPLPASSKADFFTKVFLAAVLVAIPVGVLLFVAALVSTEWTGITAWLADLEQNAAIIYLISWIILLIISFAATTQIRDILNRRKDDILRRHADQLAVICGLVLLVFLFRQSYLDRLFAGTTPEFWARALLFSGGTAVGWSVWYLNQLAKYGEFFHVLLLTVTVGFCWYARLTAPEEVQLTAVAFLLGSLFKIAKDNLDKAARLPA